MSADSGTPGSTHSSQLGVAAPLGAEDPTVIRSPSTSPADAGSAQLSPAFTAQQPATPNSVSPTLRRLFDEDESVFGIRIAEFVLEQRVGVGGMGAVFKAHDTRLSRKVALKVLSPKVSMDPTLISRFHNEARATARLSHDNIARVYSSGEALGVHFIAYELIDGTNLRELIGERGIIDPSDALNFALQIAMGLNHMTACGVVHRDIKPSNIIITPEARARVVDLGLARRDGADSIADLTVAGSTLGTFDYISPEQAQDPRSVDVRSDIYSLGCTMFHMLTGQAPYKDGTALQKLLDHKGKDAPAPHEINRKVPRSLSAVVRRMMASDPDERYAAPAVLIDELMAVASQLGLTGIQPDGLVWTAASSSLVQKYFGWISMAVVLLLVVVFLRVQPPTLQTETQWKVEPPPPRRVNSPTNVAEKAPLVSPESEAAVAALFEGVASLPKAIGFNSDEDAGNETDGGKGSSSPIRSVLGALLDVSSARRVLANRGVEIGKRTPVTPSAPTIVLRSNPEVFHESLRAACEAAEDGDVITIRPDRLNTPLIEQPFVIEKKNLTIKGPRDGPVPTVRFDVGDSATSANTKMVTIIDSVVRVFDLDIQVTTRSRAGTDRWALFAMQGAEKVEFAGVHIDMPNTERVEATIFEVTLPEDAALARMADGSPGDFQITLTNCFARGDCRLFRVSSVLSGRLQIEKSCVSLGQSVLAIDGTSETPEDGDRVDLELSRTTMVCDGGLVQMSNESLGGPVELLPLRVVAENCIMTTSSGGPLVRMIGPMESQDFKDLLTWIGSANLYEGFDAAWQIDAEQLGFDIEEFSFSEWRVFWEQSGGEAGATGSVATASPWLSDVWRDGKPADVTLDDLRLDDTSVEGEALGTATDGTDLGAPINSLQRPRPGSGTASPE